MVVGSHKVRFFGSHNRTACSSDLKASQVPLGSGLSLDAVPQAAAAYGEQLFGRIRLQGLLRQTRKYHFSIAEIEQPVELYSGVGVDFCGNQAYGELLRGLKANGVVVDIGGNIGDTAILLHLLNPSAPALRRSSPYLRRTSTCSGISKPTACHCCLSADFRTQPCPAFTLSARASVLMDGT